MCILEERARGFFMLYFVINSIAVIAQLITAAVPFILLLFKYEQMYFFYSANLAGAIWNSGLVVGLMFYL